MALADYFYRNSQAVSALVKGLDASLLEDRLCKEVVGLAYDVSAEQSQEGRAAIDLTLRLASRLYPKLAIVGLTGTKANTLRDLKKLVLGINPKIDLSEDIATATRLLVFGKTPHDSRRAKDATWYVGSENWFAKLSRSAPVGSGVSGNPLAAGAAACIAMANVFKAVFASELGGATLDEELATSLLDMRAVTEKSINPALDSVQLADVHLVGAGAIGNGVLWALARMPCEGNLQVVDHETVTHSNLQRYVMLAASDLMKPKGTLACSWLAHLGPKLSTIARDMTWAAHINSIPGHAVNTVLSAVDTAKVRIEIQSSLPRVIYNAWTQRGEAGVSRHSSFLGDKACLACLYIPTGQAPSEDVLVADALRLGRDELTVREVRRRLQLSIPTERAFLERIAAAASMKLEAIASFEGRSLRELYADGVCGGGVMAFQRAALQVKAEVPMGFQSALAGILLAAELARPVLLDQTLTQIDLLGTYPERPGSPRSKTLFPRCMCLDEDFQEVFRLKFPS